MATPALPEVTPVVPQEPPNPRKFSRSVQPKDASGNPVGQPQVFYGATEQELIDNMAKAQENATLKIRELSRKTTLETQTFAAPEGADPFVEIQEPQPRQLTADQLTALSKKFTQPDTVLEAFREAYEAETGLKPIEAGKLQVQRTKDARKASALQAAQSFMSAHPEFVPCPENREALEQFFKTRRMDATIKNFEIAFKELSAGGLLVLKPEPTPPAPEPRIETPAEVPPATTPVIPAALTRSSATGAGGPTRQKGPTPKELAMMSAAEYKLFTESPIEWQAAQLKKK